jgi:actin-like ATPase involved in cell morphogenesis
VGYHLGVDLGTKYTAAAVERDGRVQVVTLGNRTVSIPSVVFITSDGTVLVGEAAERRGVAEPERLAREFKRRVGDPTPIIIGGVPWAAEALMGKMLAWVVQRVAELEGGRPDAIALTHPANWGAYKLDLLQQAARHADVDVARLLSEPEAAATAYATNERVPNGSVIAVYDLGGGTFDAAVLQKRADGFDMRGQPEGIERLGGVDIDQAVFTHVINALGGSFGALDQADPAVIAAVGRLRRDCVDAKEALSADTDAAIPVNLPGLATEVRLTRTELEQMVRPALQESVVALHRALRSGGLGPEHVTAVLLVGGSSRIPLVSQLVASELGRPIAVDANPKDTVALGAAVAAAQAVGAGTPESVTAVTPVVQVIEQPQQAPAQAPPPQAWAPPPQPTQPMPAPAGPTGSQSKAGLVAALVAFVLLAAGAAFFVFGGDDSGGDDEEAEDTPRTVQTDEETTTTEDTIAVTVPPTVEEAEGYTPELREQFVDTCIPDQPNASDPAGVCGCFFDAFEATLPFEEFVALDEAASQGAPDFPPATDDAITACVEQFS